MLALVVHLVTLEHILKLRVLMWGVYNAMTLTTSRVSRVFSAVQAGQKNSDLSDDQIIKRAKKEGWTGGLAGSVARKMKEIVKQFVAFATGCSKEDKQSRKEAIEALTNALLLYKPSANAEEPKDIQAITNKVADLEFALASISVAPAKFRLELNSNESGHLCLSLRVISPSGAKNLPLTTFHTTIASLSTIPQTKPEDKAPSVPEVPRAPEKPVETFKGFESLRKATQLFNLRQGSQGSFKNYVDAAMEGFEGIRQQHECLKDARHVLFYGSGDGQRPNRHHLFDILKEQKEEGACYCVKGPDMYDGKGFDKLTVQGIKNIETLLEEGHNHIIITGHSRGAYEAMIASNVFSFLLRGDFEGVKKMLPKLLPKEREALMERLISLKNQLDRDGRTDNIKFMVNLLDPVKGPFHHSGFRSTKQLFITPQHVGVNWVKGVNVRRVGFDSDPPSVEALRIDRPDKEPLEQDMALMKRFHGWSVNAEHGQLSRAPRINGKGKKAGSWEGASMVARLTGLPDNYVSDEKLALQSGIDKPRNRGGEGRRRMSYDMNPFAVRV